MLINEGTIQTRCGEISYLELGNPQGIPVIALHGWLDNAASFIPIAKYTQDFHIYALDLAGHGHSYHRSFPYNYNVWDDVFDVLDFADAFNLEKFCLMGHSRGAAISSLLAASSERVSQLMLLDGVLMVFNHPKEAPKILGDYIQKRMQESAPLPVYPSIDEMIDLRIKGPLSLTQDAARLIVERSVKSVEGGFQWNTARALRWSSVVRLTEEQVQYFMAAITCPVGLWHTEKSAKMFAKHKTSFVEKDNVTLTLWPGNHHFHMETKVEALTKDLESFLAIN